MSVHSLINPSATVEIDSADFFAAAEAGRTRRVMEARQERTERQRDLNDAECQFRRSFRERFSNDLGETELALDAARDLAELAQAFAAQAAPILQRLRNVERLLVDESDFSEAAADLLTDQLSADPLARDLAGVVVATVRAEAV